MKITSDWESEIATAVLLVISDEPGIDGYTLVSGIQTQFGRWTKQDLSIQDTVFDVLDSLQDSDMVWLDDQEDAWYLMNSPEAEVAMTQYDQG